MKRRRCLVGAASLAALPLGHAGPRDLGSGSAPPPAHLPAIPAASIGSDWPVELQDLLRHWTAGRKPSPGGLVLDIPELVDNGNDVPLHVRVESPMTMAEHVRRLAVWAPRNPQALVLEAEFTPRMPRAEIVTRIRLASSQRVLATARLSDGRLLAAEVPVLVALAACLEG